VNRRILPGLFLAGIAAGTAAALPAVRRAAAPATVRSQTSVQRDSAFARLIERISEPGGYFDTDNLISNEASYLHVIGKIKEIGVSGGAYIGVGPDQNFSYIAHVRPRIAFILDIRRDNLLEHFLFKALFVEARTRLEYLSLLFGKPAPRDPAQWIEAGIEQLLDRIDSLPSSADQLERTAARVASLVTGFGYPLSAEDLATIRRFHGAFFAAGLDLRFTSFGRGVRTYYPTYRQLLSETDRAGNRAGWMANEESYRFLRSLQLNNRIVPVIGDFAGSHALREIGEVLRERGESVSAFYTSNVEFYLMQDRTFDRFAENVATLPYHEKSVMIRALFGRAYSHPQAVVGYFSTQLLQSMKAMVEEHRAGGYANYGDLVYRNYIDLRQEPVPTGANPYIR
jgi:hypothetical protein